MRVTVPPPSRIYTKTENRIDFVLHAAGFIAAAVASVWLLLNISGPVVLATVSVYCAALLGLIVCSAAYHFTPHGVLKEILSRVEHGAIFVMIAATYTPFAVNRLGYPVGNIILAAIWTLALAGIAIKLFLPSRFDALRVPLYLVMGWLIVTVVQPLSASVAAFDFWLLITGGILYTIGVVFHVFERLPFHREIWHVFVL
ncbi:MAG: hemolysin III family protein, partial [Alphaproteobacteria bacterium]